MRCCAGFLVFKMDTCDFKTNKQTKKKKKREAVFVDGGVQLLEAARLDVRGGFPSCGGQTSRD